MKKRIFAALMALCLTAGTSAFAQAPKEVPATKERPSVEQMAQRKTERMTEKLGLNAQQAKLVYTHNLQQIKQMQAKREQMGETRKAEAAKMKGILTPEQYTQWEQMQGPKPDGMHGKKTGDGSQGQYDKGGREGCGSKKDSKGCCSKSDKPCPKSTKK